MNKKPSDQSKHRLLDFRRRIHQWLLQVKELHGSPHYVAMGMAIGVFVSATPTIPFQTAIAVSMAFILRGSKIAAAAGTWVSNPVTIPFLYLESYKAGGYLFGISNACAQRCDSIAELFRQGLDIAFAALTGGVIIGIPGGIAAYFITRAAMSTIRSRKKLAEPGANHS